MRWKWKTKLLVFVVATAVQAQLPGRSSQVQPATPGTTASQQGILQAGSETLVLPRSTPFCLFITKTISTETVKAGERVTFRLGDEISAQGLTLAAPGTEVSATVTARNPGRPNRDGKLYFAFDDLRLVNGVAAPLRIIKPPDLDYPDWDFWRWVFSPLGKGDPKIQDSGACLRAEIKTNITLNAAEVRGFPSPLAGWKNRLRRLLSDSFAAMNQLERVHGLNFKHNFETGDEIAEFDFASGHEYVIGPCKHCFSPLAQPASINHFTEYRLITVFFLQADGVHALYSTEPHLLHGSRGNTSRILKGHFSAILALFGQELIVLEESPDCRILRFDAGNYPHKVLDSMDCREVLGDSPEQPYSLRSAQLLNEKYTGDAPSQLSSKRDLVTMSLAGGQANSSLQMVPVPQMQLYSRSDPTWEDTTHIVYLRKRVVN